MKGNHMVAALNAENRQLRQVLAQMEAERAQGKFLEELTCAALTGYTIRQDLTPEQAADLAVKAAEAVLNKIIHEVRKASEASGGESAAEQPVDEKNDSGLIVEP